MIERLEATLEKYEFLEQELTKPEILSDIKKTKEYSKEMSSLEDIVVCYKKYKRVGYVFRDRYKTEGIYSEEHLHSCIKYIYNNIQCTWFWVIIGIGCVRIDGFGDWYGTERHTAELCRRYYDFGVASI